MTLSSTQMLVRAVKGNRSYLWKGNSFMALKRLNGIAQGSTLPSPKRLRAGRSKAFSPACLFRFLESSAPLPNCDTVSKGGRGGDVILFMAFVLVESR